MSESEQNFGLRDTFVLRIGHELSEEELRANALDPDLAEEAIRRHRDGQMVNPFGADKFPQMGFRASLFFIYRTLYYEAHA